MMSKRPSKMPLTFQKTVMVMNSAVSVAVHDHVHLTGAGHAVVCVRAVDAAIRQIPEPRAMNILFEGPL